LVSNRPVLIWNAADFKAQIVKDLVSNSEIVGEFVEADARQRLLSISDPEWGRAYREQVVARLLMNRVEVGKNEVTTLVGVGKSRSGDHHGFYIELGSATAPAHPFLRPAVFSNAKAIVNLLEGK